MALCGTGFQPVIWSCTHGLKTRVTMIMKRTRKHPGFTLLELVLVMVIIAIALAAAAPKLRGWSRGQQLREAADSFVYFTRYARAQAVSDGIIYRLTVDANNGTYTLTKQDGDNFVAAPFDYGDTQRVPQGYRIELIQQQQQQQAAVPAADVPNTIDFYPSGRTQMASVRISASSGDGITVSCLGAAEQFAVVTGEANQ